MTQPSNSKHEDSTGKMFVTHIGLMGLILVQMYAIYRGLDMTEHHENCPDEVGLFGRHAIRKAVYHFETIMQMALTLSVLLALAWDKTGPVLFWMLWTCTFIFVSLFALLYDFHVGIQTAELQDINLLIMTLIISCLQILTLNSYYTESMWTGGYMDKEEMDPDVEWAGQAAWRDKVWKIQKDQKPKSEKEPKVFKI